MHPDRRTPVTPLLALILLASPLRADVLNEAAKLSAADGGENDQLGHAVAIDGALAVAGAPGKDGLPEDSGAAYVFDAATGQQLHKLVPSDLAPYDYFGVGVALQGTALLIGATGDDDRGPESGSVYVFDAATGQQLGKLLADDGAASDFLGGSIAVDGTTVLVGAPGDDDNGLQSGSAYLFDLATGQQVGKLLADDGAPFDYFGGPVGLAGGLAVVGSPKVDADTGAVYVFDVATGQQLAKLVPEDARPGTAFGWSLAVDGEVAVVGAPFDGPTGAAYLFDVASGQQLAKLLAGDGAPPIQFGQAVDLRGDVAVVGGHHAEGKGAAYLFDATTGQRLAELLASDGAQGDAFGYAVATDGVTAIVGAHYDDEQSQDDGSAYVFDVQVQPIGTGYCGPAVRNSTGLPGVIAAFGSDAVADECVRLVASQLPLDRFGYFLTSQTQGFVAAPPGSQGNLCLGGTIGRYATDVQGSGALGAFGLRVDLQDMPTPGQSQVNPGETWSFQAWFRDKNPTPISNFTDGVAITFQ